MRWIDNIGIFYEPKIGIILKIRRIDRHFMMQAIRDQNRLVNINIELYERWS